MTAFYIPHLLGKPYKVKDIKINEMIPESMAARLGFCCLSSSYWRDSIAKRALIG